MVKRKAAIILDEWLGQGARLVGSTTTNTAEAPVEQPRHLDSTIIETNSEAQTEQLDVVELVVEPLPVEGNQLQVTEVESEAHAWLWSILEQAGYERW